MRLSNVIGVVAVGVGTAVLGMGCNSAPTPASVETKADTRTATPEGYVVAPVSTVLFGSGSVIAKQMCIATVPTSLFSSTCDDTATGYHASVPAGTACPTLTPYGYYSWAPDADVAQLVTSDTKATPMLKAGTYACTYSFAKIQQTGSVAVPANHTDLIAKLPITTVCIGGATALTYVLGELPEMVRLPALVSFRGELISSKMLPANVACVDPVGIPLPLVGQPRYTPDLSSIPIYHPIPIGVNQTGGSGTGSCDTCASWSP